MLDEEESLAPLHRELDGALGAHPGGVEFVFVDDGSRDGSLALLRSLERADPRVRVVALGENRGQASALAAGFRVARAEVVATLDADLQNDPADIPALLERLDGADVVNGVRVARCDPAGKILGSRIANAVRNWATDERVSDVGCSLRVMRRCYLERIHLERGLHRFLPTLLRLAGARVVEAPVSHRPRRHGRSKYGTLGRLIEGLRDLRAVRALQRRAAGRVGVSRRSA